MKADFNSVAQEIQAVKIRLEVVKTRVSDLEDMALPLQGDLEGLKNRLQAQDKRIIDLADRNMRNKIRIIGISEKSEGSNPSKFVSDWLIESFGKDSFSPHFSLERAHRISGKMGEGEEC